MTIVCFVYSCSTTIVVLIGIKKLCTRHNVSLTINYSACARLVCGWICRTCWSGPCLLSQNVVLLQGCNMSITTICNTSDFLCVCDGVVNGLFKLHRSHFFSKTAINTCTSIAVKCFLKLSRFFCTDICLHVQI